MSEPQTCNFTQIYPQTVDNRSVDRESTDHVLPAVAGRLGVVALGAVIVTSAPQTMQRNLQVRPA